MMNILLSIIICLFIIGFSIGSVLLNLFFYDEEFYDEEFYDEEFRSKK